MAYRIELVMVESGGPASEDGMPVVAVLEEFATMETAHNAAEAYLKRMGRPPGSAWYKVLDERGEDVGLVK